MVMSRTFSGPEGPFGAGAGAADALGAAEAIAAAEPLGAEPPACDPPPPSALDGGLSHPGIPRAAVTAASATPTRPDSVPLHHRRATRRLGRAALDAPCEEMRELGTAS